MKIDRNEQVQCGWCGEINKLGDWSDLTYSKCTNREMKRAFTPLNDSKAFSNNSKSYYVCPDCGKWSRGNKLRIVNTDNKSLEKLGGESIILNSIKKDT